VISRWQFFGATPAHEPSTRDQKNGEVMKEKSRAESTVSSWIGCPDDVHAVIYLRYLDLLDYFSILSVPRGGVF
jgi:hypothetical protein